MLHLLTLLSSVIVIATGLYVLWKGDWHKFGLKFAGISFSVMATLWLLGADILFDGNILTCAPSLPDGACFTAEVYHIVRNIAFIVFHIAIGRDAIHFKKQDRRGAVCPKNLLRPSPL